VLSPWPISKCARAHSVDPKQSSFPQGTKTNVCACVMAPNHRQTEPFAADGAGQALTAFAQAERRQQAQLLQAQAQRRLRFSGLRGSVTTFACEALLNPILSV